MPGDDDEARRCGRLLTLKEALWKFARDHGGEFPASEAGAGSFERVWETVDPSRMRYRYVPGAKAGEGAVVVAFEPGLYGAERLALLSDGSIRKLSLDALQNALAKGR